MMFCVASIAGIMVGLCSGMLGIGGGIIMVPLFRLVFGLSPIEATATSFFTIIPTSIAGLYKHFKNHTSILTLGCCMGLAGACTSPLGVWCAAHASGWMIMVVVACVIVYSAGSMLHKVLNRSVSSLASETSSQFTPKDYVIATAIGLGAGFLGGFAGVGGGFIIVPLLVNVLGLTMVQASGTSLVAVMLLAIPGTIEQALLGNISYTIGLAMALGSVPGAIWGAGLAKRAPDKKLKLLFSGFLCVVAIVLVANEFIFVG